MKKPVPTPESTQKVRREISSSSSIPNKRIVNKQPQRDTTNNDFLLANKKKNLPNNKNNNNISNYYYDDDDEENNNTELSATRNGNNDEADEQIVQEPPPPLPTRVEDLPFPNQGRCSKHMFEPLLWYCATCRESLCTICRIEAHAKHDTMSFEAITAPTLRRLSQLERDAEARQETLHQVDVGRLVDRLCATVDTEIQYLDGRLHRRCDDIKQDVLARSAKMREEIDNELRICQEYLSKVEDTMDVLQCINVGEEPSQHPLFVPLMNGHISVSHFLRAAAPVEQYAAPRIVDSLKLLDLPIANTLEVCRRFDWTQLSAASVPEVYPRSE